ncbi:MAG: PAS domain S-box protein [Vicinamibacterales bacterium]
MSLPHGAPTSSSARDRQAFDLPKRYLVGLLAFTAALGARYAVSAWLQLDVPYLQFYPAILLASWYGGAGPGVLVSVVSSLAAMYWLLPPEGFAVAAGADRLSLAVFAATGLAISWLNYRLRSAEAAQRSAAASATARAERLDTILNTTIDGIIVVDSRGIIEAFNKGAERLFGYPEAEVLGRNVSMLMPSPHHEKHDDYLRHYLTTGEAKIIGIGREVTGRRRDGTLFPIELSVGEMHIAGERKFTGMLHDLTNRVGLEHRLGASEARWHAVVESAVDAIIVIDAHGRIESFNPAAERLFGYSADEALGRNVNLLMPSPYREEHDTYMARYVATGRAKIIGIGRDVQGQRKDGTTFPAHLSVGEVRVQGALKFTGILHDLSSRMQIEKQVREQEALVRLGEMAAVVAHEVKNPLAGIRGAIQVVGSRMPASDATQTIFKEIMSRIDSLDDMVKDLLLFARPPKPRLVTTDMAFLVRTTVDLVRQDPEFRNVTIEVEGTTPPVSIDSQMIGIVLQNLLLNSMHAMAGCGRIRISIDFIDSICQLAIADTGPGIAAEAREKIFTPFFTTKSRGSGLGLPTAKRLVEAHQGEIAVDCPPGGGTTVTIRLPTAPATGV